MLRLSDFSVPLDYTEDSLRVLLLKKLGLKLLSVMKEKRKKD